MFLSALSFLVTVAVVGFVTFCAYSLIDEKIIAPRVCSASVMRVQRYIARINWDYCQESVSDIIRDERDVRTTHLVGIGVVIFVAILLFFPSGLTFWIIPPWAIKIGLLGGFLLNIVGDYRVSRNTKGAVGAFERIDDGDGAYFEGMWSKNFHIKVNLCCFTVNNPPPIGCVYFAVDYCGYLSMVRLSPIISIVS
ncbi:hypothetical protein IJM16_01510 [Candidatus Saccharibacteria bacterium]|nr:hypothetical protein [Candidatus Saccharibacteria bacterium]